MHIFDRDTKLKETAPSVYSGAISENWLINKNPNGGYLMAILARAMMDKSEKNPQPAAVSGSGRKLKMIAFMNGYP